MTEQDYENELFEKDKQIAQLQQRLQHNALLTRQLVNLVWLRAQERYVTGRPEALTREELVDIWGERADYFG